MGAASTSTTAPTRSAAIPPIATPRTVGRWRLHRRRYELVHRRDHRAQHGRGGGYGQRFRRRDLRRRRHQHVHRRHGQRQHGHLGEWGRPPTGVDSMSAEKRPSPSPAAHSTPTTPTAAVGSRSSSGTINVSQADISSNHVTEGAGGVLLDGGTTSITQSTISNNAVTEAIGITDFVGDGGGIVSDFCNSADADQRHHRRQLGAAAGGWLLRHRLRAVRRKWRRPRHSSSTPSPATRAGRGGGNINTDDDSTLDHGREHRGRRRVRRGGRPPTAPSPMAARSRRSATT